MIGTACSGSGAPCHALAQLVGPDNYKELFASEIHAPEISIRQQVMSQKKVKVIFKMFDR